MSRRCRRRRRRRRRRKVSKRNECVQYVAFGKANQTNYLQRPHNHPTSLYLTTDVQVLYTIL